MRQKSQLSFGGNVLRNVLRPIAPSAFGAARFGSLALRAQRGAARHKPSLCTFRKTSADTMATMKTKLHDMHCHLDFMTNGEEVATQAAAAGTLLFANTVTPDGWLAARARFAGFGNVRVGFGMHPWWTSEAPRGIVDVLDEHDPAHVGEIGLDFGARHASTGPEQVAAFTAIARWAAKQGEKLISVHAVKSAGDVLTILQDAGALESCTCILHWYSGPSDQLKRAIDGGCYFSCGPRMLATKRGREYVKAIPATRLLLETDDPPEQGQPYSYAALRNNLAQAGRQIATIKGDEALAVIDETTRKLLGAI